MRKDIKQILVIGLIIASFIVCIVLFNNMKNSIQSLTSEVAMLRQESNNAQQQMMETMTNRFQSILQDSQDKISNFTTTITKITPNEQTAELKLDFEVQGVSGEGTVLVMYKTERENHWSKLEAIHSGLLTYEATFIALLKGNYEFKIVENHPTGASTQLNTRELSKNLYHEFYEMRTYNDESGRGESKEVFELNFNIINNTFGLEEYRVKSVSARVFYKDTVLFDEDITHLNLGNSEEITRRNLQIASGQTVEEQQDVIPLQDPNLQKMSFLIGLSKQNLKRDFPDLLDFGSNGYLKNQEASDFFQVEINVVYNNGEEKQLSL